MAEIAVSARLSEPITDVAHKMVLALADRCAAIVDKYQMGDANAGEEIRAMFGLG